MKSLNRTLAAALAGLILTASHAMTNTEETEFSATVMSYNLRFDNPGDGDNRWDNRKERVAALVGFYEPDFLGTQEGLLHQLEYLDDKLDGYDRIGAGRDDGAEAGEFSAIFYNRKKFEMIEGTEQTLWLSETPEEPSKAWDAALPRILTFARFRHRDSGREFCVYNTHFDHVGETARTESARLILEIIGKTGEDGIPAIVTGDFNVTEDAEPYQVLTSSESPLKDTYYATETPHVGPEFTFEGFQVMSGNNRRRIDYVFVSRSLAVRKHAILSTFRGGYYPSDHLPVLTTLAFPSGGTQ